MNKTQDSTSAVRFGFWSTRPLPIGERMDCRRCLLPRQNNGMFSSILNAPRNLRSSAAMRLGYEAVIVGLAVFLIALIAGRRPFQGYLVELQLTGPATSALTSAEAEK